MTLISDHTYSGSRFREFRVDGSTISLIENWAGKRLLAFSPALSPAVQRHVATELGIDLTLPHKTFNVWPRMWSSERIQRLFLGK